MPAKFVYTGNLSLDGFIEDARGGLEWSEPDEEIHRFWNTEVAKLEGMIMGRRLYEAMVPFWPEAAASPPGPDVVNEFAGIWMSKPRYVVSRTLSEVEGGCQLVEGDPVEWAERLKRNHHGTWGVGGAELAGELFSANLIDRLCLVVAPLLLGEGKPCFGPGFGGGKLRETGSRQFSGGARMLTYEVT